MGGGAIALGTQAASDKSRMQAVTMDTYLHLVRLLMCPESSLVSAWEGKWMVLMMVKMETVGFPL